MLSVIHSFILNFVQTDMFGLCHVPLVLYVFLFNCTPDT